MSGSFLSGLPDHPAHKLTREFAHLMEVGKQTGDETMSDELAALAGMETAEIQRLHDTHYGAMAEPTGTWMRMRYETAIRPHMELLLKRNADLEAENATLRQQYLNMSAAYEVTAERMNEFEQENAHLREQVDALTRERDGLQQQLEDEQDATSTALWYLGVDPTDWVGGESGMKAAAQGNLMIGGKTYPNRDAWGDVPEGTITDFIFKLIEAQDSK